MTSIGAVKRALAQLSPEQRERLRALVESQPAPEPVAEEPGVAPVLAQPIAQPRPAAPTRRETRLIDWRPLPPRPKPYDPLEAFR